jgi:hypothetical protein
MAQDYTDDCFASDHVVQTDMANIEKNFAALKSAFSGASAPSNLVAGMWWLDTTAHILKKRNEANNAWQSVWDLANNKPIVTNNISADFGANLKDPVAGTAGLRTLGTTAQKACAGNDSRLSDTRTPSDASVAQAKLKTSQGSVSIQNDNASVWTWSLLILPGGEYGFYPQLKTSNVVADSAASIAFKSSTVSVIETTTYTSYIYLGIFRTAHNSGYYTYAQQRYVTASGEIHWIFILRDKITKNILSMYQAPDHPCFGNGGKPLLAPHPFGSYDETKHEIIVINPSFAEIEQMEMETIVNDETKPDKDLLEVITENYEIDENSNPAWPTKPVTVGLPKHIIKEGKKILVDYRFMHKEPVVEPLRKVIPKPDYIKVKTLKRINHAK